MADHRLVIRSLRDLDAVCECGRWQYLLPARTSDTDQWLRDKALAEYQRHLVTVMKEKVRG
jgi:hypothetical protein